VNWCCRAVWNNRNKKEITTFGNDIFVSNRPGWSRLSTIAYNILYNFLFV
jgi:hypothetical protein